MITILRQHQRILMLCIAVLTIIAFIWLYNPAQTEKLGRNNVATIYGRTLSQADIDRQAKTLQLALAMRQSGLVTGLGGMTQSGELNFEEYFWNLLVFRHEAKALGIEPTDAQVAGRIKAMEAFQTAGQFDSNKYKAFLVQQLGPKGLTEAQVEDVVRDALRLERIEAVVGSPVAVSEAEVQEASRGLQKVTLRIVRFPQPENVTVSGEEIQGFYEQNRPALLLPETRSVNYVEFVLPEESRAATGREKVEALQKVADAASSFADRASAESFAAVAVAAGLAVKSAPEFDASGSTRAEAGEVAQDLPSIAPAAFLLPAEKAVSDALQSGDKFLVLELVKINPQRAMTLEEARPIAERQLREMKSSRALREAGQAALAKIRAAISGGKTLEEAAAAEGLKVEKPAEALPSDPALDPALRPAVAVSLIMEPGQVSSFIPSASGGFAVELVNRAPASEADRAGAGEIGRQIQRAKERLLFRTWLGSAREAAKITILARER